MKAHPGTSVTARPTDPLRLIDAIKQLIVIAIQQRQRPISEARCTIGPTSWGAVAFDRILI